MKVIDIIRDERLSLSFEIFPPRFDAAFGDVMSAAERIADLKPAYISVTCGAGGGSRGTLEAARRLSGSGRPPVVTHLTCVGTSQEEMRRTLDKLTELGIRNIMALRGDLPEGMDPAAMKGTAYPHASDLIRQIRSSSDLCVGAACYPEKHPESGTQAEDIRYLKVKEDAGADYLTTQMFFDNDTLFRFMEKLRAAGVTVPVVPGIMPITGAVQVERAVRLSGCHMPRRFISLVEHFGSSPAAMKQAGILYAADQIIDLYANGFRHVHVYTMNKPDVAAAVLGHLSEMLGRAFT